MDWYRYGSMCLPHNVSVKEMQRECAYFQLPDGLSIEQESARPATAVRVLEVATAAAKARHVAAAVYACFLEQGGQRGLDVNQAFCEKHNLACQLEKHYIE
eukprot:3323403-Amphidinium_carterae.1